MKPQKIMEKKKLLWFFIITVSILTVLVFYVFHTLLNTILLGLVFSYLFYPLYKFLRPKLKSRRITSFIVCVIFLLIITVPMIIAINSLATEVFSLSTKVGSNTIENMLDSFECSDNSTLCNSISGILSPGIMQTSLIDLSDTLISGMRNFVGESLIKIPSLIINMFIIIFMMFYLLIDGNKIVRKLYCYLPISDYHKSTILAKGSNTLDGILFGTLLVAAIQGVLAGIGFFIFGFKASLLWGIMAGLFALVPFLGAGIVWFPAGSYLLIESFMASDTVGIWRAIGFLLYSAIVVSTSDNFIRPELVSGKTNIHPVLVLFSVIGGLSVFNVAGIIIGPLIVGLLITILELFEQERDYIFSDSEDHDVPEKIGGDLGIVCDSDEPENNIKKSKKTSSKKKK